MTINQELIRQQLLFAGLSPQDLDWLAQQAVAVPVPAGEYAIREGEPGDALFMIAEGEFQVIKRSGNADVVIAVRGVGEVFGEMSLLEARPRGASLRAIRDSLVIKIGQPNFNRLIHTHPSATLSILRTVIERLRHTEAVLRQSEKMASLGTLSAGLAHELNNPAAAASRSSAQLSDILAEWQRRSAELGALHLDASQQDLIQTIRAEMAGRAASPAPLDPLARSDREGELQAWLEDHDMADAWEIAPNVVALGWDVRDVTQWNERFTPAQFAVWVKWLCVGCSVYALLDEVNKSTKRISEIVQAVKSYAFLDQAPIQEIDVHQGLENTLVILRHKLKAGVRVNKDYALDLPHIQAYGSELNQVWTNLIDNACDAMQGQGELTIKTYGEKDRVSVEITDNGPGIPEAIQSRIFDAFFTTKPPGVGSGLGLHISHNIIQKHHGTIRVTSKPGATTFQITLPLRLEQGGT